MRLDKYLKVSRIIKRRTIANQMCDAKKVIVNGKVTRASYEVKISDIIELTIKSHYLKIKVLALTESIKKEDASNMYIILENK